MYNLISYYYDKYNEICISLDISTNQIINNTNDSLVSYINQSLKWFYSDNKIFSNNCHKCKGSNMHLLIYKDDNKIKYLNIKNIIKDTDHLPNNMLLLNINKNFTITSKGCVDLFQLIKTNCKYLYDLSTYQQRIKSKTFHQLKAYSKDRQYNIDVNSYWFRRSLEKKVLQCEIDRIKERHLLN
jgi:hypothetical protein